MKNNQQSFDANQNSSDADWLRNQRALCHMKQSNIVSYLEITTRENVNPGRIAEIETGQRAIPSRWREKLESLFHQLQQNSSANSNWRDFI